MDPEYDYEDTTEYEDSDLAYAEDDFDPEYEEADDADAEAELDGMLRALTEDDDHDFEFDEGLRLPWKRKKKKRRPKRATGRSGYRPPIRRSYVNQKQLKDALARVGRDTRRNAMGIKTIGSRVSGLDNRVTGVAGVNRVQSKRIAKLDRLMKLDGALELVESFSAEDGSVDLFQVLKGTAKAGYLGDAKGALGNPLLVGGLGLLLKNPQILSGLVGQSQPNDTSIGSRQLDEAGKDPAS